MLLDERHEKAIGLLLMGEGPTVVSQKVGISRGTLYQWLEKEDFKNELEARRKEIVSSGNAYVIANTQSHLEVLHELAIDKKDKRTAATCAMYLVDRALGKVKSKLDISNEDENKDINIDVLDEEIREFDEEERVSNLRKIK